MDGVIAPSLLIKVLCLTSYERYDQELSYRSCVLAKLCQGDLISCILLCIQRNINIRFTSSVPIVDNRGSARSVHKTSQQSSSAISLCISVFLPKNQSTILCLKRSKIQSCQSINQRYLKWQWKFENFGGDRQQAAKIQNQKISEKLKIMCEVELPLWIACIQGDLDGVKKHLKY